MPSLSSSAGREGCTARRVTRRTGALLVLAVVASSCEVSDDRGDVGSVVPTWIVADSPHVAIGGMDDRMDYLIQGLRDAIRLPDGRLLVADYQASEIRVYSEAGRYLATVGGQGEGPGEFGLIGSVAHAGGDTVLVLDMYRGITRMTLNGDVVDTHVFDVYGMGRRECWSAEGGRSLLGDGRLLLALDENPSPPRCPGPSGSVFRFDAFVNIVDPGTLDVDSLIVLPGVERDGRNYRPYGAMPAVSVGARRIVVGETRGDSLYVFDLDTGERLAGLPVPFEARPLAAGAMEPARRRGGSRADPSASFPGDPWNFPDAYPRYARYLVDADGNTWVMRFPDVTEPSSSWSWLRATSARVPAEGAFWRVVDPVGEVVAEVRTPPGAFPIQVGRDWILTVRRDPEFDVETVEVYGLTR